MKHLLYKDLTLSISPFYFLLPILTGALMLIPGWLYFIVLLYYCFITVPNALSGLRNQNDLIFSVMMPVRKKDIVASRIVTFLILELLHIGFAVIYAIINNLMYDSTWFIFLDPTVGFFGLVFIMFSIFNIILFPMFYKTGHKYGVATIIATTIVVLFAGGAEILALKNQTFKNYINGDNMTTQLIILGIGVILYIITAFLTYKLSEKRFEKVDL